MTPPTYAVTVWYTEDTVFVNRNGEFLQFPAREPARLIAFLRTCESRTIPVRGVLRDLGWEQAAREHAAAVAAAGAERRAREDKRAERERATRNRRIEKRDRLKEAERTLKLAGL